MTEPPRASGPPQGFPRLRTVGRSSSPIEDLYHTLLTLKWWQFFLAVGLAFLVANAFFGLAYEASPGAISNTRPGSFEDGFFFSVQTMATIGYGAMSPVTRLGHVLVTLEAIIGVLAFALITGITFSKFSRPTARVLFSARAVIGPRDGVPHLMFRMANYRHNTILEAQLRVVLLVEEISLEGQVLRRPLELPLVRDRNSTFILSWTAMHPIDEKSPFFGPNALERLRGRKGELFLSLTGTDETFAQTVHARCSYQLADIVENSYFADVLTVRADGVRVIDYTRFHDVVPAKPVVVALKAAP